MEEEEESSPEWPARALEWRRLHERRPEWLRRRRE